MAMDLGLTRERLAALYREGPSFPFYLPYHSIDEGGVFSLIDGSLGRIWEVTPIAADLKGPQALDAISGGLMPLWGSPNRSCVLSVVAASLSFLASLYTSFI